MDPDAGKLYPLHEDEHGEERLPDGERVPDWFVRFQNGERVTVKGAMFTVEGLHEGRLLLQPIGTRPRRRKRKRRNGRARR
jgi:hypothetical protein